MSRAYKVTFLPANLTVEVQEGDTVLDAALDNDIRLDHACGGVCACSTCHIIVREGFASLEEASEDEEDMLDQAVCLTTTSRLGCQVIVKSDLLVDIPAQNRNLVSEMEH